MGRKIKLLFKWIGIVVGTIVFFLVFMVGILTIAEFDPEPVEELDIAKQEDTEEKSGDGVTVDTEMTIMTWNLGYCALGDNANFFMDGGSDVYTASKDRVNENLKAIKSEIQKQDADFVLLQEVDSDSSRSYHINENDSIKELLADYQNSYAYNYRVLYVPYPFPPIGAVNCGISTFSKYEINSAKRQSLPCPFKYPFRICNLKRCLMVDRIKVNDTDKELVLVNLHLEAYDSGEGKIAQTNQLKELIEEECKKGNYVIAAGDFNQAFSNVVEQSENDKDLDDKVWKPAVINVDDFEDVTFYTDSNIPTCRSLDRSYAGADKENFNFYTIDGFIVSNNISVNEVFALDLDFKNSDHNPVELKFMLNGE